MISNLTASSEAFLASTQRIQQRLENASRQASSGKRVNVASDAPSEIDTILQLRTDAARNTQIQENLSVAKADADAADGALNSATKIMDRARVLASQGATFTLVRPRWRCARGRTRRARSPRGRGAASAAAAARG